MDRPNAPSYDLFKLVVTLALVVILILMLLRGCATTAAPPPAGNGSAPTQSSGPSIATEGIPATDTEEAVAASALPSATSTTAATFTPTTSPETPTAVPATVTPESPAPEVTETVVTPTTIAAEDAGGSCSTIVPSRLGVGQTARVVERLNMRNAASITAPILQTNPVNAQVEVIGGPVCTPVGERAYLWWQIRLANGAEGWSAEAPLNEATYLLEPVP